jgi:hypothetical protein
MLAMQYPGLTKRSYSMGCAYCAARYLRDGGEDDLSKWERYGVSVREAHALRMQGEFIDPELKKRKTQ